MNQSPEPPMTLARFEQLLDAYGAEPERWPTAERAAALRLLESEPRARAAQTAALALDTQLSDVNADDPSPALRARVLEIPIRHAREHGPVRAVYSGWRLTLLALVPCVLGFFSGALLLDRPDVEDEGWNEVASLALLNDIVEEDLP